MDNPERPPRRPRYRGKNPRKFEERYKEHHLEKYPELEEHLINKGLTVAGTHRPICADEILNILRPKPGDQVCDATLGYGGHSLLLLERIAPSGKLWGVDVDGAELEKTTARLAKMGFGPDVFQANLMNYSAIRSLVYQTQGGFDCLLADLGVSSMQLDNPARGFSFKAQGPLDLRLNQSKGQSASSYLAKVSQEELETVLSENADEPLAAFLARGLKSSNSTFQTTTELSQVLKVLIQKSGKKLDLEAQKKTIQRVFMALRIAVNQEFEHLDRFLKVLPTVLKPASRVCILTFHSGEDRRVKKAFAEGFALGHNESICQNPLQASPTERRENPRAKCAKLRWAIRA